MGNLLDRLHRVAQRQVAVDRPVLDHGQHERRGAVAQVDRVLRHVRVAHDDVQAAVFLPVGMGLVAGVDDRALDHGVERHLGLEEVGALRELVLARMAAVLGTHLARAAVHLAGREERQQVLDDLLEGGPAVHQVVLVGAVAVALAIAVVLVDQHLGARGQHPIRLAPRQLDDPLAGLLEDHQVPGVGHLGAGVLRVGVVHVVPRPVRQGLVPGDVLLLVRGVLLPFHLEAARVGERILLVVVPQDLRRRVLAIGVHEKDAARDGVEITIVLDGDPVLDLGPHHLGNRHRLLVAPAGRSGYRY